MLSLITLYENGKHEECLYPPNTDIISCCHDILDDTTAFIHLSEMLPGYIMIVKDDMYGFNCNHVASILAGRIVNGKAVIARRNTSSFGLDGSEVDFLSGPEVLHINHLLDQLK